jgi:hypothetical protein
LLSLIAALGSFIAAAWVALFSRRQVNSAQQQAEAAGRQVALANAANQQAQHTAQVQLVIHFNDQFHAILGDGLDFTNATQVRRLWSLHYMEFFYFQADDIAKSLYQLWMAELAELYCADAASWTTHEQYLVRFANSFESMFEFFRGLHEVAVHNTNAPMIRDRAVIKYVAAWPLAARSSATG